MGASDLIGRLALAGVRLARLGEDRIVAEPSGALTEEFRDLIRQHKAELLSALEPVDRGREVRRQQVLAKLKAEPEKKRAAIFDAESDREFVICTVGIRGVGTFELRIPRDRHDPWLILEALNRTEPS
jgi:hypothetical protein